MSIPTLDIPVQSATLKPTIVQGDTIPKIEFSFDAGDSIDLTGATIKMQIYNKDVKIIDVDSTDGITITGAKAFEIDKVAKEDNDLPYGTHEGDLEITDSSGDRLTYMRVRYTILKQYTV